MMENDLSLRHAQFVKTITETDKVWVLEKDNGFATASSINYEDDEGEAAEVLCFWSEEALALACSKGDWEGYVPVEVPLGAFVENWCVGLDSDLIMAGIDFDDELIGEELDPLELILDIGEVLKAHNKEVVLEKYKSMDDLMEAVRKVLE